MISPLLSVSTDSFIYSTISFVCLDMITTTVVPTVSVEVRVQICNSQRFGSHQGLKISLFNDQNEEFVADVIASPVAGSLYIVEGAVSNTLSTVKLEQYGTGQLCVNMVAADGVVLSAEFWLSQHCEDSYNPNYPCYTVSRNYLIGK